MRRAVVVLLVALIACGVATAKTATPPKGIYAHRFQSGEKVKKLQWLLSGRKPSKFRIQAYKGKIHGRYDLPTSHAVRNMKYRLGWPTRSVKGSIAGNFFVAVLKGNVARPRVYYVRATKRLAQLKKIAAARVKTDCARKIVSNMRSQLGVHEIPDGSNRGPFVSPGPPNGVANYQAVTGAFGAPWCASFVQWVLLKARVGSPRAWNGSIANNSAGVFYIAGWARLHGWARSIPKPAFLAAFLDRLGHIGIVESVSTSGFTSIEGNASNQVLRRFHPFGQRPVMFIAVPGCDTG